MAIRGVSFAVPRGRHRDHPGRQRRGQDHHPQDRVRRDGPAEGHRDASTAARSRAWIPTGSRASASATCRRGARSSRSSPCARTCAMGAYTRRDADGVARDMEMVYEYFPVLKSRAEQRAGSLSGGEQQMLAISRALMARPGHDAAGRAVARPLAPAGQGHLRHHRAHQPGAGRDRAPGRAERQHGAAPSPTTAMSWRWAAS